MSSSVHHIECSNLFYKIGAMYIETGDLFRIYEHQSKLWAAKELESDFKGITKA